MPYRYSSCWVLFFIHPGISKIFGKHKGGQANPPHRVEVAGRPTACRIKVFFLSVSLPSNTLEMKVDICLVRVWQLDLGLTLLFDNTSLMHFHFDIIDFFKMCCLVGVRCTLQQPADIFNLSMRFGVC